MRRLFWDLHGKKGVQSLEVLYAAARFAGCPDVHTLHHPFSRYAVGSMVCCGDGMRNITDNSRRKTDGL